MRDLIVVCAGTDGGVLGHAAVTVGVSKTCFGFGLRIIFRICVV